MKRFGNTKLRTKMIVTTVAVCIFALLIQGGVLLYLSTQTFSRTAYEDMAYLLESKHTLLNNKMLYVENIVLGLRNDPAIQAFFEGEFEESQIEKQYAFCTNLSSEQNLINSYVPFVKEVFLLNRHNDFLSEFYDITTMSSQEKEEAQQAALDLSALYRQTATTINCRVENGRLYLIVKLYSPQLTEQGLCIIGVDLNTLEMLLQENAQYEDAFWAVLGPDGMPIMSYGKELEEEERRLLWQDQQYYMHTVELNGVPYQVMPANLSFGLKSVAAVPSAQIYTNLWIMTMSTLMTLTLLIPLLLGVAFLSSWTLTKPLKTVAGKIKQFGRGDFGTRLETFHVQEFDEIGSVFNEMTEQIHNLITQVYENQLLATRAEIRYLQSQMNPHFLYNVLSTIALQAKLGGNEDVYRMVYSLSKLLQGKVFRSGEIKIRLREELELVRFYLYLQNIRFSDRLAYRIECEESLLDFLVPRMSIEPLVENAVIHGLEPKEGDGIVELTVNREGELLCIRVRDDGVGFSTSRVEPEGHAHMGFRNIEQLIHNLYGEEYGMQVESLPGKGTLIVLRIPAEMGAETSGLQENAASGEPDCAKGAGNQEEISCGR